MAWWQNALILITFVAWNVFIWLTVNFIRGSWVLAGRDLWGRHKPSDLARRRDVRSGHLRWGRCHVWTDNGNIKVELLIRKHCNISTVPLNNSVRVTLHRHLLDLFDCVCRTCSKMLVDVRLCKVLLVLLFKWYHTYLESNVKLPYLVTYR